VAEVDSWKEIIEDHQARERRSMEILVNPDKTPTEETFTAEFFRYVSTKIPAQEKGEDTEVDLGASEGGDKQKTVHISHHFIANIIDRCFNEERFFPLKVLNFMICSKLLSVSETKMLPKLVEKRELVSCLFPSVCLTLLELNLLVCISASLHLPLLCRRA